MTDSIRLLGGMSSYQILCVDEDGMLKTTGIIDSFENVKQKMQQAELYTQALNQMIKRGLILYPKNAVFKPSVNNPTYEVSQPDLMTSSVFKLDPVTPDRFGRIIHKIL